MEFRPRVLSKIPEPVLPSPEQEVQTKQQLKNVLSEIISNLSVERLRELAKDIRILERAILLAEPHIDLRRDARAILSGPFSDSEGLRAKVTSELTQIAGGIVNTIPASQVAVLLQDIPGLFSMIKYGGYIGERGQTNKLPINDEKVVLRIMSKAK